MHSQVYEDIMSALRVWYSNVDEIAIIPAKWQSLWLTEEIVSSARESEVQLFWEYVSKVTTFHEQLKPPYHSNEILRENLLMAVDTPSIQVSFCSGIPHAA